MANIPTKIAPQPDISSTHVNQIVSARTITGFTNNLVHLSGFRGMRYIQQICEIGNVFLNDIPPSGAFMADDPRMRWTVSPMARYLWWGCFYCAEATVGTFVPAITVFLSDTVGGPALETHRYDEGAGNLRTNRYRNPAHFGQHSQTDARDEFVHTGWALEAAGTTPKLFDLKGLEGTDVQIQVTAFNARIHSMFALEIAEGVVG